jgi:hypothetical protein
MGEGDVCVSWGRREKKGRGYVGGGGGKKRKKKKGNKKEKRNEELNLRVWWEKRGSGKERKKKFLKVKKLNWFYFYIHFVWCKV